MMVMSASASLVDTGRIKNGADPAERLSAVDNALDWTLSGGRRLQCELPREAGRKIRRMTVSF